jgi:DNA-binding transcriptional ArsR family regulator
MKTKQSPRAAVARTAELFQLLGDPSRLRIVLCLLEEEEACVGDVCAAVGQSQPAVSHHLMLLRAGRLVESRRDGKRKLYRVSSPVVPRLLRLAGAN